MKTISRYIMTLALLITAVGGAWAQTTVQCSLDDITIEPGGSATTNFNLTNPDDKFCACQFTIQFPQGISIAYDNDEEEYVASMISNRNKHHSLDVVYNSVYTVTVASHQDFLGTEGPLINFSIVADNNAVAGNYDCYITNVTLTKTEGDPVTFESIPFKVTISGSEPAPAEPTIDVTTNAASAQDLFTEASFTMPTFDVDVNYELVRDMQDETNPVAFSGLPTNDEPIVVKKGDDGKYQPAEALTIQLIDPVAAAEAQNIIAADGITIKVLVGNGGTPIEYDQVNPMTLEAFLADMKPGYYWIKAEPTDENSPYDGTVYSSQFTIVEQYDLTVKPANDFSKGKIESVTVGSKSVTIDANTGEATKTGIAPDTEVKIKAKRGYVIEKVEAKKPLALSAATAENIGMVVCAAGHLHDAKTALPDACTAVGILGKVTGTGHGLIFALQNAPTQTWNTINGWTSVTTYAGTTLKVLPDDYARGTNLTSYATLGATAVSNWAVAQDEDYKAIFENLGSTTGDGNGKTYDGNVNVYITSGVGGTAMSDTYWSATESDAGNAWRFSNSNWADYGKSGLRTVRPVLGF